MISLDQTRYPSPGGAPRSRGSRPPRAVIATGLPQRRPERPSVPGRRVELPAKLTDIGDSQGQQRYLPDRDLARGEIREACLGHVVARERREDVASPRSPQPEADPRRGHITDLCRAVVRQVRPQPARVVIAGRRAGHEHEPVGGEPCHSQVGLDPAAPIEQLGIHDRARRRSMSLPATRWRKAHAPGPLTSSFANDVSSNSAAA